MTGDIKHGSQRLHNVLAEMSDVLQATAWIDGECRIDLKAQALTPVAEHLAERLDATLAALFVAPDGYPDGRPSGRPSGGRVGQVGQVEWAREVWRLHAVLPAVDDQAYLHLRAQLAPGDRDLPLLNRHFTVAARYQKENTAAGMVRPVKEELELDGAGVFHFPLGPVRGDCNETVDFLIDTSGEHMLRLTPSLGYKHRGLEERAVGLAPDVAVMLAERASGIQAVAHALAFCQASERLAGLIVPPRAAVLRAVLSELERIASHLLDAGLMIGAAGHTVGAAQVDQLRERLLRLHLSYFGHRYLFGAVAPGGVRRDLSPDEADGLRLAVGQLAGDWQRLLAMVMAAPGIIDRWETTGILDNADARSLAVVGPVARASGVDLDTRRDHPYAAYSQFPLPVPVYRDGDCLARFRVRADELDASFRMLQVALAQMPDGVVQSDVPAVWPAGEALGWVEAPQGETLHWVCVNDKGTIAAYRIRAASYANWAAFGPAAASGNILTDFPLIDTSFNQSCADCDR